MSEEIMRIDCAVIWEIAHHYLSLLFFFMNDSVAQWNGESTIVLRMTELHIYELDENTFRFAKATLVSRFV